MVEIKKSKRGGRRPGAGRPKLAEEEKHPRPQCNMRAWPEEWALIKRFANIVKTDKIMAEKELMRIEKKLNKE